MEEMDEYAFRKPVLLMILDGWGISSQKEGNAIAEAATPHMDRLQAEYGRSQLLCSGEFVGLPEGQQGNSEVGHLNLGAGRVVYQELTRINQAVRDHTLHQNAVLKEAMTYCQKQHKPLHLMGLVSPGGVHSHSDHLLALLQMAKEEGLRQVYLHCFLDGRDVGPTTAKGYLETLEQQLEQIGVGKIATVSGRYYAMDRDHRWERIEKAYRAMTNAEGLEASSAVAAIVQSYAEGVTDEFVLPTVIMKDGNPVGQIGRGDGVIFYNFRGDRAREITQCFVSDDFSAFQREKPEVYFVTMTQYEEGLPVHVAFLPQDLKHTLGQVLSENGIAQFRTAETEKYAHVTFFFNGGIEEPYPFEDRLLVPSPKVATYDLQPSMSALAVKDALVQAIISGKHLFYLVNFANTDMVGHTGCMQATVEAAEAVDRCIGEIITAMQAAGGTVLITADHGNAEQMEDETGSPFTSHTANPVPFIAVTNTPVKVQDGSLQDIAPTVLALFGIEKPTEMTGNSLIQF